MRSCEERYRIVLFRGGGEVSLSFTTATHEYAINNTWRSALCQVHRAAGVAEVEWWPLPVRGRGERGARGGGMNLGWAGAAHRHCFEQRPDFARQVSSGPDDSSCSGWKGCMQDQNDRRATAVQYCGEIEGSRGVGEVCERDIYPCEWRVVREGAGHSRRHARLPAHVCRQAANIWYLGMEVLGGDGDVSFSGPVDGTQYSLIRWECIGIVACGPNFHLCSG